MTFVRFFKRTKNLATPVISRKNNEAIRNRNNWKLCYVFNMYAKSKL